MVTTRFTELAGCSLPIQQAGMGGVATPELAAAVSNAGGLGMVAAAGVPTPVLTGLLEQTASLTDRPFGVNFLIPFIDDREAVSVAALGARLVEFFYGEPDTSLVDLVHAGGALACWQVGSADEARAAEAAGCDLIVAQGTEAGGHVRGTAGMYETLTEVLAAVSVPVLAAGGMSNGEQAAAALAAGASGVRLGTVFVATHESGAHPEYIQALVEAKADDTVLTEAYSVMWPDAPHRVLWSCVEAAEASPDEVVGEDHSGPQPLPIPRFFVAPPTRATTGNIRAMALYAGMSVEGAASIRPAGEIVRELAAGLG